MIGIIGGSGIYDMELIKNAKEIKVKTPFGDPSDSFIVGEVSGSKVAFLPRHRGGHTISPTELNVRANIYGFKKLGANSIISAFAVGSMKEEIKPLDIVIPDQIIDRTKHRNDSFFTDGIVVHVSLADPFCNILREVLCKTIKKMGLRVHDGGTYVCIEGPQFSTRAESKLYRSWGVDVIGMTAFPEARLAREAEICYAAMAFSTDYDCWKGEDVNAEMVIDNLMKNSKNMKSIIKEVIPKIPSERKCSCSSALKNSIVTSAGNIPAKTKERLAPIIGKYVRS